MLDQGGIYKLTLYENKGISYNWPDNTNEHEIDSVTTTGDTITLDICANNFELDNTWEPGFNLKLNSEHTLTFFVHNFSENSINLLEQLVESVYGWILELTMNNGKVFIIPAPFFIEGFDGVETSESESFSIDMAPQVATNVEVLQYV